MYTLPHLYCVYMVVAQMHHMDCITNQDKKVRRFVVHLPVPLYPPVV